MPSLTVPTQRFIGSGLVLLMILTRGQHFASVDALPSASWAIFFLAAMYAVTAPARTRSPDEVRDLSSLIKGKSPGLRPGYRGMT